MRFEGIIQALSGTCVLGIHGVPHAKSYRYRVLTDSGLSLYVFRALSRAHFKLQDRVAGEYVEQATDFRVVHRFGRLR